MSFHQNRLIVFVLLIALATLYAQDKTPVIIPSKMSRKSIKGEQFLRQTMTAKVKNGPIPQAILNLLLDNVDLNLTSRGEDSRVTPMLITENVKTTVTRTEIPLSTIYMDSDWYNTTLKKFLIKNKISLSNSSSIESADDSMPPYADILHKLNAALRLRTNLITSFRLLLQNTKAITLLPAGHHPALSLIYQLLVLRRVPLIGMLESIDKFTSKKHVESYITVFSELWEVVPKYAMSCVTLWLETLQDGTTKINEHFLSTFLPKGNLISGLSQNDTVLKTPLLFSKGTLQNISRENEILMGRTLAAIISGVSQGTIPLCAALFTALFLIFPLNKPAFDGVDELSFMEITEEEEWTFQQAIRDLRPAFHKVPLIDIFKSIISRVQQTPNVFEGKGKYDEFMKYLEGPSEGFMFHQFSVLAMDVEDTF